MSTSPLRRALLGAALLVGLAAPLAPRDASATTVAKLSTEQLTDAAEYIVVGTIVDVWTELDDRGMVWTHGTLEVERQLKGAPVQTIVVSHAGGVHGSTAMKVFGTARFSEGEEGVFFLSTRGHGERVQVVGMAQGKYTVRMDPYSRQPIVQRVVLEPLVAYDHRFLPLPAEADRLSLDSFLDTIQDRLDSGWDGQAIPGIDPVELQRRNAVALPTAPAEVK
ncbi:MAG: hypothetical protein H6742_12925 [Alphaproteobacteria bacterium]|nr:hypothetical protein [Alphaproteobacteria bacterium]